MIPSRYRGLEKTQKEIVEMLDRIRTEIEQRPYGVAIDSVIQGMKYERAGILEIIDKYKAESESPEALEQDPKYCDRNICIQNEYNGIGCNECEVTKSQESKTGR